LRALVGPEIIAPMLPTLRELTSGFDFCHVSSPHGRVASTHQIWCK